MDLAGPRGGPAKSDCGVGLAVVESQRLEQVAHPSMETDKPKQQLQQHGGIS